MAFEQGGDGIESRLLMGRKVPAGLQFSGPDSARYFRRHCERSEETLAGVEKQDNYRIRILISFPLRALGEVL